jgi:Zn-dependent protease
METKETENFDELNIEEQLLRSRKWIEEFGEEEDLKKWVEYINEANSLVMEEKPFNWTKTLLSAVLSFVAIYFIFGFDIFFSIIFMLTLLIHELGHFVMQKRYAFHNVSLIFYGPIGAVVSGYSKNNSESENFWMYLMGPLPGLLISLSIFLFFWFFPSHLPSQIVEYLIFFAVMSLYINAFNLFPGGFLDGARIFSICFDKYPLGSWIFNILLSVILLIYLSFDLLESISNGEVASSIILGVVLAFLLYYIKPILNRRIPEVKRISTKFSRFLMERYGKIPNEIDYDMASYIYYQLENSERDDIFIYEIWNDSSNPPSELQRKRYIAIYFSVIVMTACMFYFFCQ